MREADRIGATRAIGIALILFAIGFNLPFAWLGAHFGYPDILRKPPGEILAAFAQGGAPLIAAWAAFAVAALLFAPVAIGVARVTRRPGDLSAAIAALGIGAGITQAIGLSRWVYAVPMLAAEWTASPDPAARHVIETLFLTLHQSAGVGIGEAIGQSLTAFWLIGVALAQQGHPRFGRRLALLGVIAGIILLLGLVEGMATVLAFDPGLFGVAAPLGFGLLTLWLIWTGLRCIRHPIDPE